MITDSKKMFSWLTKHFFLAIRLFYSKEEFFSWWKKKKCVKKKILAARGKNGLSLYKENIFSASEHISVGVVAFFFKATLGKRLILNGIVSRIVHFCPKKFSYPCPHAYRQISCSWTCISFVSSTIVWMETVSFISLTHKIRQFHDNINLKRFDWVLPLLCYLTFGRSHSPVTTTMTNCTKYSRFREETISNHGISIDCSLPTANIIQSQKHKKATFLGP